MPLIGGNEFRDVDRLAPCSMIDQFQETQTTGPNEVGVYNRSPLPIPAFLMTSFFPSRLHSLVAR